MKKLYASLFIFLFSLLLFSGIQAQQSDYRITTDFEEQYDSLNKAIHTASAVWMLDSLNVEIDSLKMAYDSHEKLLDNALYPETFDGAIAKIRSQAGSAEQRLLLIESQGERLERLGSELAKYQSELTFMNNKADSLKRAITASQESEERLSKLVSEYRQSLQSRDELILEVVDSLMITYSGMTQQRMQEIAEGVRTGRISGNENPLNLIKEMLDENIEFAKATNSALNVEDHLRMYAVQNHFSETWDRLGDRLVETYAGDEKNNWNATINGKLKEWRMVASQKMWNSLDSYLEFEKMEMDAFDNNYSFFVALDNFVKEAKTNSEGKILNAENYNDYKKFEQFWSGKIKNEWSNLVQNTDVLTVAQISSIDEQLNGWEAQSRPVHPLLLLLIVITIISILGFGFAMFKSKKA